jgi:penicillin-binding protein 1A
VTLFEMTRAFGAFANNGNRVDPYAILEVRTSDGTVLYQYRPAPPIPVMNQRTLQEMNQMMFEVVQTGTGQRADLDPRPVGAKTGTSQEWRDAWFVGYTADFVTGVWIGNDDNTSMKKVVGGSLPASIWKAYMLAAHKNIPVHNLPGVDMYSESDAYAQNEPDNPWVERDGEYTDRHVPDDRPGVIEDFFDSLFGGDHPRNAAPVPPPPPAPRYVPQSNQPADEDDDGVNVDADGAPSVAATATRRPRRVQAPDPEEPADEPEPDPNEPPPN